MTAPQCSSALRRSSRRTKSPARPKGRRWRHGRLRSRSGARCVAYAGSVGLDVLDDLAAALLDSPDTAAVSLARPVLILMAPASQTFSDGVQAHALFEEEIETKKRASKEAPPEGPKCKKQKTSRHATKQEATPAKEVKPKRPKVDFTLSADAPVTMRIALEDMYSEAADVDKWPYQLAYPWLGRALWYDPVKFSGVHMDHWRFWLGCRRAFFEWALHVPVVPVKSAQT
jgi:hypothetical protein